MEWDPTTPLWHYGGCSLRSLICYGIPCDECCNYNFWPASWEFLSGQATRRCIKQLDIASSLITHPYKASATCEAATLGRSEGLPTSEQGFSFFIFLIRPKSVSEVFIFTIGNRKLPSLFASFAPNGNNPLPSSLRRALTAFVCKRNTLWRSCQKRALHSSVLLI